jgi:hypothetical protein
MSVTAIHYTLMVKFENKDYIPEDEEMFAYLVGLYQTRGSSTVGTFGEELGLAFADRMSSQDYVASPLLEF